VTATNIYRQKCQPLTAPKKNAEFVQVANAILSVREARNFLHLPFPFVLLIKFIG
jgi:hypothetical protein